MADFFIRRPIVAMVISILMVIMGLITLRSIPISKYPESFNGWRYPQVGGTGSGLGAV